MYRCDHVDSNTLAAWPEKALADGQHLPRERPAISQQKEQGEQGEGEQDRAVRDLRAQFAADEQRRSAMKSGPQIGRSDWVA